MSNKEKEDIYRGHVHLFFLGISKDIFFFFCFLLFIEVERKVEGSEEGEGSVAIL